MKELPQAERDRFGEIVFRFFLGSCTARALLRRSAPGQLPADADGRVAFLDFGMAKQISREQVDVELAR